MLSVSESDPNIGTRNCGTARLVTFGAILITLLISTWPIFTTENLPLYDYPNHLARMHVIAHVNESPQLQQFFTVRWAAIPNLAMEAVIVPLAHYMPVEVAGKVFIILTFGLSLLGVVLLFRALHGRYGIFPLVASVFLYNDSFMHGFLSYLFSVGVYLIGFSCWIRSRESPWHYRLIAFSAFSTALYFLHLYALGLYAISVVCYELSAGIRAGKSWRSFLSLDWAATLGQFVIPGLIFFLASPTSDAASRTSFKDWIDPGFYASKILYLWYMIEGYSLPLDVLTALFLVVTFTVAWSRKRTRVAPEMTLLLIVLSVLFLAFPETLFSSWGADRRLMLPLVLVAIASCDWQFPVGWVRPTLFIAFFLILVGRICVVTEAWKRSDAIYREYRAVFRSLPVGARLTGAFAYTKGARAMAKEALNHLGNYLVIDRDGFYSTFFADPAQQPIALNFNRRFELVEFKGSELKKDFLSHWRDPFSPEFLKHYDFIVVRGEEKFEAPIPENLEPVASGADFRLFKIHHDKAGSGAETLPAARLTPAPLNNGANGANLSNQPKLNKR